MNIKLKPIEVKEILDIINDNKKETHFCVFD
jgi:hypothetical protein